MIEAIKEIGEFVSKTGPQGSSLLEGICLRVANKKGKEEKTQHTIIFDFKTDIKKIEIEVQETNCKEADGDSGKAYLWVDNFKGNKPPINITSDRSDNILSKTLPAINEKLQEKELSKEIERVINIFFSKKEVTDGKKKATKYYIKPEYFDLSEDTLKKLKELEGKIDSAKGNEDIEKGIKIFLKETGKLILSSKGKTTDDVNLFTVKINDHLICQKEGYKNMISHAKIENLFSQDGDYTKNLQTGICSICGNNGKTTSNATNLKFKFYMTDKVGFSSNLDGKFTKNYNICKKCYQDLMLAEKFIRENLKSYIGSLSVYIIPNFIHKVNNFDFIKFSEGIKSKTNSVSNIDSLNEFQHDLERFKDHEQIKSKFVINYLFYHQPPGSSEFKILKLIKDVPPSRLDQITEKEDEISNLVNKNYNGHKTLKIALDQIWFCIPVKKDKQGGKKAGYLRYLDIIDAVFSGEMVDYDFLINQFTEVLKIIYYEREGYNIWTNQDFVKKILQMNFLFLFLKKINCLGGFNMTGIKNVNGKNVDEMIPKEIQQYWNDLGTYEDDSRKGLFLLGYLIGEIGKAQKSKGIDKKPILNKITFQGMGREKLLRLVNEIFEKLSQYDRLKYNENIFSASQLLVDGNINEWKLSDQENVFYTLSGYAFSNFLGYQKYVNGLWDKIARIDAEINTLKKEGKDVKNEADLLDKAKKAIVEKEYKEVNEILKKLKEKQTIKVEVE